MSDPMHGNTVVRGGLKTRFIERMGQELSHMKKILAEMGEDLGGVHLEASCDQVTECLYQDTPLDSLLQRYTSKCDPRLSVT